MKRYTKAIGDQEKKQVETLKILKPGAQQWILKYEIRQNPLNEEMNKLKMIFYI